MQFCRSVLEREGLNEVLVPVGGGVQKIGSNQSEHNISGGRYWKIEVLEN